MAAKIRLNDRLKAEYEQLFALAEIRPQHLRAVEAQVKRILAPASVPRYQAVAAATGVPSHVVGIIHSLEAGCDFGCHLHNGDPITARTVHVPTGRPKQDPFDWTVGAIDALRLDCLDRWTDWSVAGTAFALERYNGFGYRLAHPHVKSPYLWSFSTIYTAGKYIRDGSWSETARSAQSGGMVLLKHMQQRGLVALDRTLAPAAPPRDDGAKPRPFARGDGAGGGSAAAPRNPGRYLRRGLVGADVEAVQRQLLRLGIADCGAADGDFGERTEAAVRLFQARGVDAAGDPLEIDGIVGPQTWQALFGGPLDLVPAEPPRPGSLLGAVLDVAGDAVGVRERPVGSNRGPEVDRYLAAVDPGLVGHPWCMAFVYWCFQKAAARVGARNTAPRTASVLHSWEMAAERNLGTRVSAEAAARDPALVRPGAVFYLSTGNGTGHAGIVEDVVDGKLVTIEGNSNDVGAREGIGVFRRPSRRMATVDLGYILF